MEPFSKFNHDPLQNIIAKTNNLPTDILANHVKCILLEHLRIFTLFLFFSIETFLSLQKECKPIFHFLPLSCVLLFFALKYFLSKPQPVYLVDFSCLEPPNYCRVPFSSFIEHVSTMDIFDEKSVAFMTKILLASGLGEQTYLPPALHYIPPRTYQNESLKEVRMVLFPVMDDLLSKTKLSPQDIDILIVNCSGFCPSPSLSSIIINKYSMRNDIKSFNLSGMGCSAGALGIDLAQSLFKTHKNSYAIVLSTEILSTGWYSGNERPKLLLNCVFRMGSAAILLTNRKEEKKRSKYRLLKTARTQRAFDDKAYLSAMREEDSDGKTGVTLNRDLLRVAGEVLHSNITIISSSILPYTEMIRHGFSIIWKKFFDKSSNFYTPNFKSAIQHFCLPTSGKPVVREIGKGLKLSERDMEAALMTLHRFGNQSSSSLWYELAYMEAKERVKKGDKVWQLGMGTGPKCTSLVWVCNRPILGEFRKGPWANTIGHYPVPEINGHI
ncbi:3-Oxoacyl-[acyl-carrier-protein (ACP)] synthase III, C-terminal [Dillenia turbinata]|uniref:3-ketoacyl-CoA synthase n=1 Tax=Dillenia turbinata TaxID=194707 RepID=A0AAN8V470_9MAGN